MKRVNMIAVGILLCCVSVLFDSYFGNAEAEHSAWDCPECGRTGITKNYCGGCAYPAPWIEGVSGRISRDEFRKVGNIVKFGHYEQDANTGNGKESIEWVVLDYDAKNNRTLLLSWYGLDAKPYSTEHVDITWEKCTLRTWLNGEFMNNAFNAKEQEVILITNLDNRRAQGYSEWNTNGGKNTQDKIFLLSYAEANKYLAVTWKDTANMKSRTSFTEYARQAGAWTDYGYKTTEKKRAGWWWLRSPGHLQSFTACVGMSGSLDNYINTSLGCVRPTFWINLESEIFLSENEER